MTTAILCLFPSISHADSENLWRETWAGTIVTEDSWLAYFGATAAPFGQIHDNGVRLRITGGSGEYDVCEGFTFRGKCLIGNVIRGRSNFGDILVGYQQAFGALTTKAFLGVSVNANDIPEGPFQHTDIANGTEVGPKLAVELWYDADDGTWIALNASATTAQDTYAASLRSAYRINPDLSLGTELSIDGNGLDLGDKAGSFARVYIRTGAFARYTWGNSEISLGGGLSGGTADGLHIPYGALNVATKF